MSAVGKSLGNSSVLSTFWGAEGSGEGRSTVSPAFQEAPLVELEDPRISRFGKKQSLNELKSLFYLPCQRNK